tara:strand:- start:2232 stop:3551 length:1320 start_codon:yes stop_codon:yes gene_type:complete
MRINIPITPDARLLVALALLAVLGLLVGVGATGSAVWNAAAALTFILVMADFFAVWRLRSPIVRRVIPTSLSLGVLSPVKLEIESRGMYRPRARIVDVYPTSFEARGLPLEMRFEPGVSTYQYHLRATERGNAEFGPTHCLLRSPLGFWWRKLAAGDSSVVRVYPNFSAVSRYALMAMEDRLSEIGVRKRRRRGEGSEFQQLREYREGDSLRQIDWRATARVRKLISREYQDERDQSVLFMLDCGRRMRAQDGTLSHFDEALNAVLLLAYVALRKGDAVGVSTFGGQERWLAPMKGHASINRMLNQLYDLQPSLSTPDYTRAAIEMLARHNKHAMIIMVTNLRDEDAEDLQAAVRTLARRHTVLVASMREAAIEAVAQAPPRDFDAALSVAAAHHYVESRQGQLDALRKQGIGCVDVLPSELSVELVNLYLAMKARGAF